MDSYFDHGVKLVGTFRVKGVVHFDGEIQGEIFSSNHFIVGKSGKVNGDIRTFDISNMGTIHGNVEAENRVALMNESHLVGDITTYHFVVDEGANFEGRCKMSDAPKKNLSESPPMAQRIFTPVKQETSSSNKNRRKMGAIFSAALVLALGLGAFYPKLSGDNLNAILNRGDAYLTQKKYVEAEAEFAKALERSKENPRIYAGLGEVYFSKKQFDDALAQFKRSIEINPSESLYHAKLAKTYVAMGQLKEAESIYKKVLDIDPKNDEAYYGVGLIRIKENDTKKAIESIEHAVALNPKIHKYHKVLSDLFAESGVLDRAKKETEAAILLA